MHGASLLAADLLFRMVSRLPSKTYQTKISKPNLLMQTCHIIPIKPNLQNQTFQNKPTKINLPNQTKPTKPNLPNQTYQTKPTRPNLPNQTFLTKPNLLNLLLKSRKQIKQRYKKGQARRSLP